MRVKGYFMVLVHKFIASLLLVAMFAAGPLCTCAFAMTPDMAQTHTSQNSVAHEACENERASNDWHSDCQDQCQDSALEDATFVLMEAAAVASEKVELAIVKGERNVPSPIFATVRQRGPPVPWQIRAQTLVSLHTLLLV